MNSRRQTNIDNYLYEIIDDYKHSNSDKDKNDIFNSFCSSIWASNNKRRVYNKTIKFTIRKDLLKTDVGQAWDKWAEVEYKGYKSISEKTDWCSLIRQKINNLYTRYFDEEVILNRDYMCLLNTPKQLYYQWINGSDIISTNIKGGNINADVITSEHNNHSTKIIDGTIRNAGFNDGKDRILWLSEGVIELQSAAIGNESLYLASDKILLHDVLSATESGIQLMQNTTVQGFELVKSLNSHKVFLDWNESGLQLQVNGTSIGRVLTLDDNSSWTENGNYRTGSSINNRNLASVEYVQKKFNQLKDEISELKQKIK